MPDMGDLAWQACQGYWWLGCDDEQ